MPLRIGLSGLNAASADLKVIGNNIANTATTGFKESRAEFADVYAQSYGSISKTAIGSGVRLASTTQQFSQGNIEYTDNALDLAINGQGFFVLDDNGSRVYSRAGAFEVDRDGYVVNNQGQRLQVYAAHESGTKTTFDTGALTDLHLDFGDQAPSASAEVSASINLRSDAEANMVVDPNDETKKIVAPFNKNDPDTYNYSTSVTLYDSLGTPRTATMYFSKKENAGEWEVNTVVEGATQETGTPPVTSDIKGTANLKFGADGKLTSDSDTKISWTGGADFQFSNGATIGAIPVSGASTDPSVVNFDLSNLTQYGTKYSVSDLTQDGYATGQLSNFDVDQTGIVYASYSNGHSTPLGKVALANFANPQGLQQLGDSTWAESYAAGEPVFGDPGSSNLGLIQSGGLEASNVDIADSLVSLITAQRNYQANAKTITTADEAIQTVLNI